MAKKTYTAKKYTYADADMVRDHLVEEAALHIAINHEPFTITMRTPGQDEALAHGLLLSENIIDSTESFPIQIVTEKNGQTKINVSLPDYRHETGLKSKRNLLSVSSCGICGKTDLEEVEGHVHNGHRLSLDELMDMFAQMNKKQNLFIQSGGSHGAAIFDANGEMMSLMEDIGRHNAVDKSIGQLILEEQLNDAYCLTVSGRVSYEIIIKAFRAKIPVLAAVSAPSSLAVDYARKLGVTLLGFCRENKATCYSHAGRIKRAEVNFKITVI